MSVRLPTDGYVRPGRYFPVEIKTDASVRLSLAADGCVPTDATVDGRLTVPVLAVAPTGDLHGGEGLPVPLRPMADDERLVGTTATAPADLIPGVRAVTIRLDAGDPLPGPPAAWEVLDAAVLDPAAMAGVSDGRRSALLAGGVTLAVVGPGRPDDRWPWERRGSAWVLVARPAGPRGVVDPDAYVPTEAWTPRAPAAVRVGAAVVAGLLVFATVALVRKPTRWRTAAAVAVPLATAAAVAGWEAAVDPTARGGGDVTVTGPAAWQRDAWVYARARSAADVTVPWAGWTHPVFPSDAAVAADRPRLTVAADGRLAFALHLSAGAAMAFVHRDVGPPAPAPAVTGDLGAAMRDAGPLYLSRGSRLVGETAPTAAGRWPGVAIERP